MHYRWGNLTFFEFIFVEEIFERYTLYFLRQYHSL